MKMTDYLAIKSENDRIFAEGGFGLMQSVYYAPDAVVPEERGRSEYYSVDAHTVSMTSIECAIANRDKEPVVLNFANALVPGGAYILGGNAQEESLCRASGLYYSICEAKEFYAANRRHVLPDYTDGMIYSESIPIIRDDSGERLAEPFMCSFITSPAVNRREAFLMSSAKLDGVMQRRIEKIVSFAGSLEGKLIILGAFGCGAFGNDRRAILPMFEQAVNKYTADSTEIVFAIP